MKNHNDYINDPYFLKWIFQPDHLSEKYWNSFIDEHPEEKNLVLSLKEELGFLKLKNEDLSNDEKKILLQNILEKKKNKRNYKKLHLYRVKFLRYAAAVLVPFFMILAAYWYFNEHSRETIDIVAGIQPGSRNALLVLDNGKTMDLMNDTIKSLVEDDGTIIENSEEELSYSAQIEEKNKKTLYNTLIVPRAGEYRLVLSDGSRVYVNSMSKLIFPVKFIGNTRELSLEGEACFIVKKDSLHPFIVNVNGLKVEVLGTTFNINAYHDDNNIITTLVEGKVKLTDESNPQNQILLHPDEQVVFNSYKRNLNVTKVNAKKYTQWIDGVYTFNNQSLEDIMRTLSRWYDFNYWFEQDEIKDIKFEGGLNKYESIEPILDIIESTGKVEISINGKNILFMKK